jgi:hypothetical protein
MNEKLYKHGLFEKNSAKLCVRVLLKFVFIFQRLNEIHVERSPALKKLMKQDEISEEPVRRVTTRASVQSSPWDVRI